MRLCVGTATVSLPLSFALFKANADVPEGHGNGLVAHQPLVSAYHKTGLDPALSRQDCNRLVAGFTTCAGRLTASCALAMTPSTTIVQSVQAAAHMLASLQCHMRMYKSR